jgi:hypothetical protein
MLKSNMIFNRLGTSDKCDQHSCSTIENETTGHAGRPQGELASGEHTVPRTSKDTTATRRGMLGLTLSRELIHQINNINEDSTTTESVHPKSVTASDATSSQRRVLFDCSKNQSAQHTESDVDSIQTESYQSQFYSIKTQHDKSSSSPPTPALPPRPASCRAAPQTSRSTLFDADMLRAVKLKPNASRGRRPNRRETLGGNTGPSSMTQALQRALDEKFKGLR